MLIIILITSLLVNVALYIQCRHYYKTLEKIAYSDIGENKMRALAINDL